jgi:amino acid transporter
MVIFTIGIALALWLGFQYGPVTGYSLMGTILTIIILPIYFTAALACPIYYFRRRRAEMNWLVHAVIPVLGMAFLVPAFVTGAGIHLFSFVAPLSYPLNLAGPIAGAWFAIGIGLMIYLLVRHPERISQTATIFVDDAPDDEALPLARVLEPEPEPAL